MNQKPTLKHLPPLTDKQKEVLFGVGIEHLTPKEILDKYGDMLTDEQKNVLGINSNNAHKPELP